MSSLDRTLLVSNCIYLLVKQALMAAANGQPGTAEAVLSVWAMASGAAGSAASDRQQLPMFGTLDGLEGAIKRLLAVMQVWQCRQRPGKQSVDMGYAVGCLSHARVSKSLCGSLRLPS